MELIIVAKTLVFNDSGEALVMRRSLDDSHRAGGPDIPGGEIEVGEGEDVFQGAGREIHNETGLQVGRLTILWTNMEVRHDDQGRPSKQFIRFLCAATVSGVPEVVESDEHIAGQSQFLPVDNVRQELADTNWAAGIDHAMGLPLLDPYISVDNDSEAA